MSVLDPWLDAAEIAAALRHPSQGLVVLLGAEAWCAKCREFRPLFDAAAGQANSVSWLWLDLEDHTDFIGDFIPDDLPLLLVYRESQLVHAAVADAAGLERIQSSNFVLQQSAPAALQTRLLAEDWTTK